jgi:hypothetical protein
LSAGALPDHSRLTLLLRPDCSLCEQMLGDLRSLQAQLPLPPLRIIDVDSDPLLQRRYGLKVPVLLIDDTPICSYRLDTAELRRMLNRP